MKQSTRYLIIGGSAAGMAAAQTIRQCDPAGQIVVASDEVDAPYFRPMIPFLISGRKKAEAIFLQGQGPYQAGGIELLLKTRANDVNTTARVVTTPEGKTIPYDRLLLATGSRPYLPHQIKGLELDGVFAVRTLADARKAAIKAGHINSAVMIGGGLVNLKTAFALLERGITVTLVVSSPEVLSRLMEPGDAGLIRQSLDKAGLKVIAGQSVLEIIGDNGGVCAVLLDSGRELACGMVCIGKGVTANADWLDNPAITVDGGFVVDHHCRTSVPEIFVAGDVAVTYDPITGDSMMTGLWTNAVEMGRCAGANMAGLRTAYGGTFGILNATQVAKMPFVSMGLVHNIGTDYETHIDSSKAWYRKLVFSADGNRLIGAVFIGDIAKAGLYRLLIREKKPIAHLKKELVDHRLHYGHLLYRP